MGTRKSRAKRRRRKDRRKQERQTSIEVKNTVIDRWWPELSAVEAPPDSTTRAPLAISGTLHELPELSEPLEPLESPDGANQYPLSSLLPKRPWDEVYPDIDDELKAKFELWDEIYEDRNEVPLVELLDPPLLLPTESEITNDRQAAPLVEEILDRIWDYSIQLDNSCRHATPLSTYRILVNEILPTARVNPKMKEAGIVQFYQMYQHCDLCLEEIALSYEFEDEEEL